MRAVVAVETDIGHVREGNEDTYLVMDPLFVVADGMGGHRGGEVASRLAVETMEHLFERGEGTLAELVQEANRAVFERSMLDRAVAGMGTTLTAALVEGDTIHLAHVGDSRAYLLRDGTLRQITDDHTLVHRMVQDGELTPAQARTHPHRSILTRSIGVDMLVEVDDLTFPIHVGDRLLLCSDGLTDMLDDPQIERILQDAPTPRTAVQRLVHEANQAGGVDNITALLIQIEEGDPPATTRVREARVGPNAEPARGTVTTDTEGGGGPPEPTGSAEEELPPPPPRPLARARRPLTWAAITLAILVVAFVGLRVYLDTQWYVGESGGRVAVFRGIPAAVAGFDLHHVVVETTISAADAEQLALYRDLRDGITANDRADAGAIVDQIRVDLAQAGGSSA